MAKGVRGTIKMGGYINHSIGLDISRKSFLKGGARGLVVRVSNTIEIPKQEVWYFVGVEDLLIEGAHMSAAFRGDINCSCIKDTCANRQLRINSSTSSGNSGG